eukprot:5168143-Pyramimonas_sp.AAC.1
MRRPLRHEVSMFAVLMTPEMFWTQGWPARSSWGTMLKSPEMMYGRSREARKTEISFTTLILKLL